LGPLRAIPQFSDKPIIIIILLLLVVVVVKIITISHIRSHIRSNLMSLSKAHNRMGFTPKIPVNPP
jgi:predicted Holliday junction resolvase-like endonuclease